MPQIDPDHQDGTSDAASREAAPANRRPGELAFAASLLGGSLFLLWDAYGISGFSSLSSPGAIPMAATFAMVLSAAVILIATSRLPRDRTQSLARDILPPVVLIFAAFLIAYGILLRPLGFLPSSALFLIVAIKILARRGWGWTLAVSLGSLVLIWLIFRIVFTVLIPAGIVPEAEIIQFFRSLIAGGAQ